MRGTTKPKMASECDITSSINKALQNSKYNHYLCQRISWNDNSRFYNSSGLSCYGSNITDTCIVSKSGTKLYTIRPSNWNEKIGVLKSDRIALVVEDDDTDKPKLKNITLKTLLQNSSKYGKYINLKTKDLSSDLDDKVSVRFQTAFYPLKKGEDENIEFCASSYNYQTQSNDSPKNLLILCSSQGIAISANKKGYSNLFHHKVRKESKTSVGEHWLQMNKTRFKVGQQQNENFMDKLDNQNKNRASSQHIGTKAMGKRCNSIMTIQVPLVNMKDFQSSTPTPPNLFGFSQQKFNQTATNNCGFSGFGKAPPPVPSWSTMVGATSQSFGFSGFGGAPPPPPPPPPGQSSVGRISIGTPNNSTAVKFNDSSILIRHPNQHITVTIVIYYAVQGGNPSENDIWKACEDLDMLYDKCEETGDLSKIDFMLEKADKLPDLPMKVPIIENTSKKTENLKSILKKVTENKDKEIDYDKLAQSLLKADDTKINCNLFLGYFDDVLCDQESLLNFKNGIDKFKINDATFLVHWKNLYDIPKVTFPSKNHICQNLIIKLSPAWFTSSDSAFSTINSIEEILNSIDQIISKIKDIYNPSGNIFLIIASGNKYESLVAAYGVIQRYSLIQFEDNGVRKLKDLRQDERAGFFAEKIGEIMVKKLVNVQEKDETSANFVLE